MGRLTAPSVPCMHGVVGLRSNAIGATRTAVRDFVPSIVCRTACFGSRGQLWDTLKLSIGPLCYPERGKQCFDDRGHFARSACLCGHSAVYVQGVRFASAPNVGLTQLCLLALLCA